LRCFFIENLLNGGLRLGKNTSRIVSFSFLSKGEFRLTLFSLRLFSKKGVFQIACTQVGTAIRGSYLISWEDAMPSSERFTTRNDRRRHPRIAYHIPLDYVVDGRSYKDFIENISYAGALIETPEAFLRGQEISIAFLFPFSEDPIKGVAEIVWTQTGKLGVKFKSLKLRGKELQFNQATSLNKNLAIIKKEAAKMGRIKSKRICWEASSSPDVVRYRIYWSKCGEVNYSSEHAELGKRTEVILPDQVPSFPLISAEMEVGITAVNDAGNESEMIAIKAYFNFTVPAAPSNLRLEDP
jgi:hypothetical protein